MATLADLQGRIAAVRRKEHRVIVTSGLFRSLTVLVVTLLAYFLIDWIFDLPYAARLVFATAGLGVIGYIVNKYLIRELRRIQDDDEIALRLEARNPALRGRLISTLQLSRAAEHQQYAGSPELLNALEEETVRMSEPLDFFGIVNTEMLIRLGVIAGMVLLIKGALVFEFPDYFSALGVRLLKPTAHFPTKTRIKEIDMPRLVVRGEDVPIEITVEGEIPAQPGTAYFQSTTRDTNVPIELLAIGGPKFRGVLTKALEDVSVTIHIGDARSEAMLLKVAPRPEVDVNASGECIAYKRPAYTHQSDPPPERFGGLSCLVGSTASMKFIATKRLVSAVLEEADGRTFPFKKRAEKRTERKDNVVVEKIVEWWELPSVPVDKPGSFHLSLVDIDGLKNSHPPVEYPIDARPDMPPIIKLIRPSRDLTVTPAAKLNVSFSARDDWGVRTTWIAYRVQTEAQGDAPSEIKRLERPVPAENGICPTVVPATTFSWDIAALNVKPGDQVVFWLEADDDCPGNDTMAIGHPRRGGDANSDGQPKAPQIQMPRTVDIKLTVVTREEKIQELQAEVERLYALLVQQKDNQEELKTKVRGLIEEIRKLKGE